MIEVTKQILTNNQLNDIITKNRERFNEKLSIVEQKYLKSMEKIRDFLKNFIDERNRDRKHLRDSQNKYAELERKFQELDGERSSALKQVHSLEQERRVRDELHTSETEKRDKLNQELNKAVTDLKIELATKTEALRLLTDQAESNKRELLTAKEDYQQQIKIFSQDARDDAQRQKDAAQKLSKQVQKLERELSESNSKLQEAQVVLRNLEQSSKQEIRLRDEKLSQQEIIIKSRDSNDESSGSSNYAYILFEQGLDAFAKNMKNTEELATTSTRRLEEKIRVLEKMLYRLGTMFAKKLQDAKLATEMEYERKMADLKKRMRESMKEQEREAQTFLKLQLEKIAKLEQREKDNNDINEERIERLKRVEEALSEAQKKLEKEHARVEELILKISHEEKLNLELTNANKRLLDEKDSISMKHKKEVEQSKNEVEKLKFAMHELAMSCERLLKHNDATGKRSQEKIENLDAKLQHSTKLISSLREKQIASLHALRDKVKTLSVQNNEHIKEKMQLNKRIDELTQIMRDRYQTETTRFASQAEAIMEQTFKNLNRNALASHEKRLVRCAKNLSKLGAWVKNSKDTIERQRKEIEEYGSDYDDDEPLLQVTTPSPITKLTPKLDFGKLKSSPVLSAKEDIRIAEKKFIALLQEVGADTSSLSGKSIFSMLRTNRHYSMEIMNDPVANEKFINEEYSFGKKAIQLWIERTIGQDFDPSLDFFENLLPGIILCDLMAEIAPHDMATHEVNRTSHEVFNAVNNINVFNNACIKLNLPRQNVINFNDLRDKKNVENTLTCLAFLYIQSILMSGSYHGQMESDELFKLANKNASPQKISPTRPPVQKISPGRVFGELSVPTISTEVSTPRKIELSLPSQPMAITPRKFDQIAPKLLGLVSTPRREAITPRRSPIDAVRAEPPPNLTPIKIESRVTQPRTNSIDLNQRRNRSQSLTPGLMKQYEQYKSEQINTQSPTQPQYGTPQLTSRTRLRLNGGTPLDQDRMDGEGNLTGRGGNLTNRGNVTSRGEEGNTTARGLLMNIEKKQIEEEVGGESTARNTETARNFELRRKSAVEQQDAQTEIIVQNWIENTLGIAFEDGFYQTLSNGYILCKLMDTLFPGSIAMSKVKESSTSTWHSADNLRTFFSACQSVGIPQRLNFEVEDLKENKKAVISCLAAIHVRSQQPYTPESVKPIDISGKLTSRGSMRIPRYQSPTANNSPFGNSPSPSRRTMSPITPTPVDFNLLSPVNTTPVSAPTPDVFKPQQTEEEKKITAQIEKAIQERLWEGYSLYSNLKDGTYLCMLMCKFHPNAISSQKVVASASTRKTIVGQPAVEAFLKDCQEVVKIPAEELFTYEQLKNETNRRKVLDCLTWVMSGKTGPVTLLPKISIPKISTPNSPDVDLMNTVPYNDDIDMLIDELEEADNTKQSITLKDEINFSKISEINSEQFTSLAVVLAKHHTIKAMDLSDCKLNGDLVQIFVYELVRKLSIVEDLELSGNEINENALKSLIKLINDSTHLKTLVISYKESDTKLIEEIAKAANARKETHPNFSLVLNKVGK
jgi:hypothetical protein